MVVFICNSCGESLKKSAVGKHLNQCWSKSISCVDCNKDFTDDYNLHTQCVSEDQKYGGLDYKPKDNAFKGKAKQEEWIASVKKVINESNCNNQLKTMMQKLVTFDNIPRKKPKFENFVRNCLHITNGYYVQQMWDIFEKGIKTQNIAKESDVKRKSNASDICGLESKKFKSNDCESNDNTNQINGNKECQQLSDFDSSCLEIKPKVKINKIIVEILMNSDKNELSLKKLRKKVFKRFKSIDESVNKEEIVLKFDKKINKNKKIVINEGKVSLK